MVVVNFINGIPRNVNDIHFMIISCEFGFTNHSQETFTRNIPNVKPIK